MPALLRPTLTALGIACLLSAASSGSAFAQAKQPAAPAQQTAPAPQAAPAQAPAMIGANLAAVSGAFMRGIIERSFVLVNREPSAGGRSPASRRSPPR